MADPQPLRSFSGRSAEVTFSSINKLRAKLLDLTKRNRLLNFPHSERSRAHIRVADELPDVLFGKLTAGSTLTFKAVDLPEPEPTDEQAEE